MSAEPFNTFALATPMATSPLPAGDVVLVEEGGVTKQTTVAQIVASSAPVQVARVKFGGQTADLALTTIFTTAVAGLYRVSCAGWAPTTDGGAGSVEAQMLFTDPAGNMSSPSSALATVVLNAPTTNNPEPAFDFTAGAGTNIQLQALGGGTYGSATWSLLVTIELLVAA